MTKAGPDTSTATLEAEFFRDDEVDPDLLRIQRRPPLFQALLILIVMAFAGLVAYTYRSELLYAYANEDPIEIGAIEDLAHELDSNPDLLLQYPSNSYVHLSGIPQRRSGTDDQLYQQLVGAMVFVELPREASDPIFRDIELVPTPGELEQRMQRLYIDDNGRWLHFSELGRREAGLIDFYQRGYNLWFCSHELTREQRQFFQLQRDEVRAELQEQLDRDPSPEEIEAAFSEQFHCQHGFLFQAGRAPGDFQIYVALFVFLALVELGGLGFLFLWFKRTLASLRS